MSRHFSMGSSTRLRECTIRFLLCARKHCNLHEARKVGEEEFSKVINELLKDQTERTRWRRSELNEQSSSEIYSCATGTLFGHLQALHQKLRLQCKETTSDVCRFGSLGFAFSFPYQLPSPFRFHSLRDEIQVMLEAKKTQASEWLNEIRIPMRHVSLFIARSGEWMRPSVANSCFLYRLMPRSRFRFQLLRTSFHSTILNATTTTIRWSDLRNYTHDSIWPFKKEEIKSLRLETWKVFFFREP